MLTNGWRASRFRRRCRPGCPNVCKDFAFCGWPLKEPLGRTGLPVVGLEDGGMGVDEPHLKPDNRYMSEANNNYGRKMEIIGFRWLNSPEV